MAFFFEELEINGVYKVKSHYAKDQRGIYIKNYEKNVFREYGIDLKITESSEIYSQKGTIRGLHFQTIDAQAKLVHVIKGSIFDVAVDLRNDSATFGKWVGNLLCENDYTQIYIPEGFAHGFLALEENTIFSYECTGKYIPEACGGIIYNDSDLQISWPLDNIENLILSEKDKVAMSFKEYCALYGA